MWMARYLWQWPTPWSQWVMQQRGTTWVTHYLNDFAMMGPPGSEICHHNLHTMQSVCRELGVPLAEDKVEDPTTYLIFWGIEVDTQAGVLCLPAHSLSCMRKALSLWSARRTYIYHRRELESLLGTLQNACRLVKPGRAFIHRMIDLLQSLGAMKGHHHIPTELSVLHRHPVAEDICEAPKRGVHVPLPRATGDIRCVGQLGL